MFISVFPRICSVTVFLCSIFSEQCYYQRASVRHPGTGCFQLPHTVALVSFPATADSRRGLAFTVDQCPVNGNGPIIKVSQWVYITNTAIFLEPRPQILAHSAPFTFSRLDSSTVSPEIKEMIHVGDSVLEINGRAVQNIPLDEVRGYIHNGIYFIPQGWWNSRFWLVRGWLWWYFQPQGKLY